MRLNFGHWDAWGAGRKPKSISAGPGELGNRQSFVPIEEVPDEQPTTEEGALEDSKLEESPLMNLPDAENTASGIAPEETGPTLYERQVHTAVKDAERADALAERGEQIADGFPSTDGKMRGVPLIDRDDRRSFKGDTHGKRGRIQREHGTSWK